MYHSEKKMSNSFQIMEIIYNKINAILKEIVSKLKYQLFLQNAVICDAYQGYQASDLQFLCHDGEIKAQ